MLNVEPDVVVQPMSEFTSCAYQASIGFVPRRRYCRGPAHILSPLPAFRFDVHGVPVLYVHMLLVDYL